MEGEAICGLTLAALRKEGLGVPAGVSSLFLGRVRDSSIKI